MSHAIFKEALKILQSKFAIVMLSGTHFLVSLDQVEAIKSGRTRANLSLMKKTDGDLAMRRLLEATPLPSDSKTVASFWVDPGTKIFTRIAFDPNDKDASTLNLWADSPIIAAKGDWSIIKNYLFVIICSRSRKKYKYLRRYLAHMVQRPGEKPGVMIVLIGPQGVGKGLFFQLLSKIWPTTFLLVSNIHSIVTGFSSALECRYVVCLDEGMFHGDKVAIERLKSTITEPFVSVEEKFQPQRSIRSVHRFFAATNNAHYATVDRDDRRFVFFEVSAERQGDHEYYAKLVAAMDDPAVIAAMMADLKSTNLTHFNVRNRPRTVELASQKLQSLAGVSRFWFEILCAGDLRGTDQRSSLHLPAPEPWNEARFIATARLIELVKSADPTAARFGLIQQGEVHNRVLKLCPSAKSARRAGVSAGGLSKDTAQQRGIDLPSLAQARMDFERFMGMQIDWELGVAKSGEVAVEGVRDVSVVPPDSPEGGGNSQPNPPQVATLATLATPFNSNKKNIDMLSQTGGNGGNSGKFSPPSHKPLMSLPDLEALLKTTPRTRQEDWHRTHRYWHEFEMRNNRIVWRMTAALRTPLSEWRGDDQHTLEQVSYRTEAEYIEAVRLYQLYLCEDLHRRFLPDMLNLAYSMLIHYGGTHRQAFDFVKKHFDDFVPGLPALQTRLTNSFDDEVASMRKNRPSLMEYVDHARDLALNIDWLFDEEFRYCFFNGLSYGYQLPTLRSIP